MRNEKRRLERRQQKRQRRRTAVMHEDGKRTVVRHSSTKGYNVEMIRDFLGQLLLELRVQHYENLNFLRALEDIEDPAEALEATPTSRELVEQIGEYMAKYETTLLYADAMDKRNVTREELRAAQMAILEIQIKLRDDQIGHMEALQELFDEALLCAKSPFEVNADGTEVRPTHVWNASEIIDSTLETPDFDKLAAAYVGHPFTKQEFMDGLTTVEVIIATNDSVAKPILLFGRAKVEAVADRSVSPGTYLPVMVASPEELKLLVAVIAKCKGRHDYRGSYYDEF